MKIQVRCPKCNGFGNFILNTETNETSCKDCGVVFNKLTTKEKLEQLGWRIIYKHTIYTFWYKESNLSYFNKKKMFDMSDFNTEYLMLEHFNLILEYIKENSK